jgi:hypothetical protein
MFEWLRRKKSGGKAQKSPPKPQWQPARPVDAQPSTIDADTTLVIVDMQTFWLQQLTQEARDSTLSVVLNEIDDAKAVGAAIILLEYAGYDATHPAIHERLKGYARWEAHPEPVLKSSVGGGKEVMKACTDRGYSTKRMRLNGIYTDQCVLQTAVGLAAFDNVSVDVVVDACCTTKTGYNWAAYLPQLVRRPAPSATDSVAA